MTLTHGSITAEIEYESSIYNCSGHYANKTAIITCELNSDECTFSANKISSDSNSSSPTPNQSVDISEETQTVENTILEHSKGTWCFIGGYSEIVAIYIDENINVYISDPASIEEQIENNMISYIETEPEQIGDSYIIFTLSDGTEAGIFFYGVHTEINYYSNGFSAGFAKQSTSQLNSCPNLKETVENST